MITRLNVASIYVLDKDEALDFYVTSSASKWAPTSCRAATAG